MLTSDFRLVTVAVLATLPIFLITACGSQPSQGKAANRVAEGKVLYEMYCAECHGFQGEGQPNWKEPNSEGIYPAPPHDSSGHTWHHADDLLLEIIAQGGTMPNSQMPGFADQMSEEEMKLTLEYIKTFWSERDQEFQKQVTKQSSGIDQ